MMNINPAEQATVGYAAKVFYRANKSRINSKNFEKFFSFGKRRFRIWKLGVKFTLFWGAVAGFI